MGKPKITLKKGDGEPIDFFKAKKVDVHGKIRKCSILDLFYFFDGDVFLKTTPIEIDIIDEPSEINDS